MASQRLEKIAFGIAFGFFKIQDKISKSRGKGGIRSKDEDQITGLDIPEMGVLGYVNEDPITVKDAGVEHISTHGPGVPTKVGKVESKAGVRQG